VKIRGRLILMWLSILAGRDVNAAQSYDVVFELDVKGVRYIVEIINQGTALLVINHSRESVTLSPSDIVFAFNGMHFSPCVLNMASLFGLGAPGMSVTVNPNQRAFFGLSGRSAPGGCENMERPVIVNANVSIEINRQKLHYVGAAVPERQ
jgi:hypothetical protein